MRRGKDRLPSQPVLTSAQVAAALAVVQAATGTTANEGFSEIQQIRAADDNLNANGGGAGYGSGLYFIAFLGTPSATGTWMLQYGGHHMATNIFYINGVVMGATPIVKGKVVGQVSTGKPFLTCSTTFAVAGACG